MEVKILEEDKNRLVFEIHGEGHTLANALRKELWQDKHITAAGYQMDHPLLGNPKMVVETDGKAPRKAVEDAVSRLQTNNEKFQEKVKKEMK
ncbi:MAG TPA: DNA-directed RNA polymerase subunit L [Candidatus Nanoarchaeia archaeon]|nr:DNA-directed RNA polymerase subunit L [Candidatus Nanoarchaeia archaeon]